MEISIPNNWRHVTLGTFLDFLTKIEPNKPAKLAAIHNAANETDREKAVNDVSSVEYHAEILPYFVRVIAHFSGHKAGELMGMPKELAEKTYHALLNFLKVPKDAPYTKTIEYDGETWHLPAEHLMGATVGEWVEANQAIQLADKEPLLSIPKLLCILLRKKGEAFSDDLFERENFWRGLTMDKVWQVWFFFIVLQTKLELSSLYCLQNQSQ